MQNLFLKKILFICWIENKFLLNLKISRRNIKMIREKWKQHQLDIWERTYTFFVPDSIITCHLGYLRSDFKKWKEERIKVISTISKDNRTRARIKYCLLRCVCWGVDHKNASQLEIWWQLWERNIFCSKRDFDFI